MDNNNEEKKLKRRWEELFIKGAKNLMDSEKLDIINYLPPKETEEFLRLEYKLGYSDFNPDQKD